MLATVAFLSLFSAEIAQPTPTPPTFSTPYDAQYRQCVQGAAMTAIAQGAPRDAALVAIANINLPNQEIITLSRAQPESSMELWDYLAMMVDDERVADGQAAFLSQREFLYDLGIRTGVDPATIVAFWGIETNYGRILGRRNVIDALATLGCTNRPRAQFFKTELVAAIKIQAQGHVDANNFIGSWAGAFGHTQFMPTTFQRLAVDANSDGRKNLIGDVQDALASTANYMVRSGWVRGEKWGYEVRVPAGYRGAIGRGNTRTLTTWRALGVKQANGADIPQSGASYGLIRPAGNRGPAYLVGRNYSAVYAYNPAQAYALAVNLLADRIKGGAGIVTPWPTDDPPISRAQRREIQTILQNMGYDVGAIDGILGEKTRTALNGFYRSNGLVFDGRVASRCLATMRQFRPNGQNKN